MWESSKDAINKEPKEKIISGWPRLDNVTTEVDSIPTGVSYEYNPTNGLVSKETAPVVMIPSDIANNSFEEWNNDKPVGWSGNGMLETRITKDGTRAILCGTKTETSSYGSNPLTIPLLYEIQDSSGNPLISSTASISTKSWQYCRITLPPTTGQKRVRLVFKAEGGIISSEQFLIYGDSMSFYAQGYWGESYEQDQDSKILTKGILLDYIKSGTYYSPVISEKQRIIETEYAYSQYPQIEAKHMLSQAGTTTVKDSDGCMLGLSIVTWKDFDDTNDIRFYPEAQYIWLDNIESGDSKLASANSLDTNPELIRQAVTE